jgi:tetratricopeptide (TPR) repeat protein
MSADLATLISQAAAALSRDDLAGAEQAARTAMTASGNRSSDAFHLLGLTRIRQNRLEEAAALLAQADHAHPGQPQLLLNLGKVLAATGRLAEAEEVLGRSLEIAPAPTFKADIASDLFAVQRQQHKREAALQTATLLRTLDPARTSFDDERFDLLVELGRHDEALTLMQAMLKRDPSDARLHRHYNGLLHRLGRDGEMFASYDAAAPSSTLQMDKAALLSLAGRHEDAHAALVALLAHEEDHLPALLAAAAALTQLGRSGEAIALLEKAQQRQPDNFSLKAGIGNATLQGGDPQKAAAILEEVVARDPHDHHGLARLSTAWRLLGEEHDETLMGYDDLVRIFDLEPPPGFSSMAAFNVELEANLAALHPQTREFLGQSLRGGTQTHGHLFGGGHALVEMLRVRIDEAVARYIGELDADPSHPLRGRKRGGFAYSGSWSSRLADCGFHVNHIHPMGWISSCYYVGVPGAVADEKARQGWIKFGEPDFDCGLPIRRAIQPQPGRLVLFPSYMWHGTIPFRGEEKRTTIAFDVVPT